MTTAYRLTPEFTAKPSLPPSAVLVPARPVMVTAWCLPVWSPSLTGACVFLGIVSLYVIVAAATGSL